MLSETESAHELVHHVNNLLYQVFSTEELAVVHKTLNEDEFFSCMKSIRKELFESDFYHKLLRNYLASFGFDKNEVGFEPLRLRAIRPNGHSNPRARAVYYPHRDTWYGHGQSVIVGWIPLHDQSKQQTFEIYPDWLDRAVPNNSEIFDYDQWNSVNSDKRIGWQNKNTGLTANYPQALEEVDPGKRIGFSCKKSQSLFFSGAHFHQTIKQTTDHCRYSVDFRLIHLNDYRNGMGAPNSDNRSKGSSLKDYLPL